MRPFELREFSMDELEQKLHEMREKLMGMRFKKYVETPKPSDIKKTRREIARIKTLINEKKREKNKTEGEL